MKADSSPSSSTTAGFATEQAVKLLKRLTLQIARTLKAGTAGEVHDLRVIIRRFTRALAVLSPCLPRSELKKIRRGLKRIMTGAGSVRNCDIAIQLVAKMADASSPLMRKLNQERDEASRALAASLKRRVARNVSGKWRVALQSASDAEEYGAVPVRATASKILPRMAQKYFRWGNAAARDEARAEELHPFRIAAKEFRYTLDLFAPVYGASTRGMIEQLKGIQTLLGGINDCATVRRMVKRHKGDRKILAALREKQLAKTRQFRRDWAAALSGHSARQWTDTLRNAAGD